MIPRLEPDPRLPPDRIERGFLARLSDVLRALLGKVNTCLDGYVGGVVSITAAYTVQRGDVTVLANAAGGAFAVTLQAPGEAKDKTMFFRKTEAGANNVTLTPPSGLIDGAATLALTAAAPRQRVVCDGTNFYTV